MQNYFEHKRTVKGKVKGQTTKSEQKNPVTIEATGFFYGSRRRIRTLTNRVRVCRATFTQSGQIAPAPAGTSVIIRIETGLVKKYFPIFLAFILCLTQVEILLSNALLGQHQTGVWAPLLHQLGVATLLNNPLSLHHGDAVRVPDGREPMGDDDGGAPLAEFVEGGLDFRLSDAV